MRIGVIGCGNVGFAHLLWLHNKGFSVIGLDTNVNVQQAIVKSLGVHALAKGVEDLLDCDSIHICVPTEPNEDGTADLSIIENVVSDIAKYFYESDNLSVVQRSTCPPDTANKYAKLLGPNISYGVNPSFLRKASIEFDTEKPERIAIGGNGLVVEHLNIIYKDIDCPRFYSESRSTVELLKYVENTIDAMLISYWNEILNYAALINLDVSDMVQIMQHIGDRPKFRSVVRVPGKAFGLWCLPKDINALLFSMADKGAISNTMKGVLETNQMIENNQGVGDLPAKKLWDDLSNNSIILPDGIKQMKNYMNSIKQKS